MRRGRDGPTNSVFLGSRHKHVQTLNHLFSFKFIYYIAAIVSAADVSNIGWILVQMMICMKLPWSNHCVMSDVTLNLMPLSAESIQTKKEGIAVGRFSLCRWKGSCHPVGKFMPSCWQVLNQIGFIPKPLGFYIQVFQTSFHFLSCQYMT